MRRKFNVQNRHLRRSITATMDPQIDPRTYIESHAKSQLPNRTGTDYIDAINKYNKIENQIKVSDIPVSLTP
jgi:hypothetical protein